MKSQQQRGFTLIELLVVMTLLAVIMAGLVSALRTIAQTESKIDKRLERLDEIRVARHFLQQTMTRVSAMTLDAPGATGKKIIPFTATADSLIWVGIMPARPSVGGRHFFRLSIEDTPQGREMVLRFAPWKPDTLAPDWTNTESRILITGIHQLSVQAQGQAPAKRNPAEPWPMAWQIGWPVTDTLPEQLRLKLVDAQGDWPDWIIALHALPQGDSSFTRSIAGPI